MSTHLTAARVGSNIAGNSVREYQACGRGVKERMWGSKYGHLGGVAGEDRRPDLRRLQVERTLDPSSNRYRIVGARFVEHNARSGTTDGVHIAVETRERGPYWR